MARVADAVVSAFLVYVQPQAEQEEAVGLASARANERAVELIPSVMRLLEVLLRQHVIGARRSIAAEQVESGYEVQHLCVGFVDLVDSTSLAQTSTVRGARCPPECVRGVWPPSVCSMAAGAWSSSSATRCSSPRRPSNAAGTIATALAAALAAHPGLPEARCGLAVGDVTLKGGDVFGPVVNLAARVVREAAPGEALVAASEADVAEGRPGRLEPVGHTGCSRASPIRFSSIGWSAEPPPNVGAAPPAPSGATLAPPARHPRLGAQRHRRPSRPAAYGELMPTPVLLREVAERYAGTVGTKDADAYAALFTRMPSRSTRTRPAAMSGATRSGTSSRTRSTPARRSPSTS